jgi:GntR family transcriptional regulator
MPMENTVDPASPLPRWAQIAAILRQRVAQRGPQLTGLSDQALTREFGVSPVTVRQAVQQLVVEGLVTRHRGKGTFVVQTPLQGSLDHLEAFMREWRVQGHDVQITILERSAVAASIPIAAALNIRPGQLVGFLRRLRCADGLPVAIDYRHIPWEVNAQLEDKDLEHEAIWETVERKLGLAPRQSNTTIKATAATAEEASLLDIPPHSPVLNREFQLIATNAQPVLTGHSIYHPNRFVYATTIRTMRM